MADPKPLSDAEKAMFSAAEKSDIDKMVLLASQGVSPNTKNPEGKSAMKVLEEKMKDKPKEFAAARDRINKVLAKTAKTETPADFLGEAFKKFLNEQPKGTVENPVDRDPLNPPKSEMVKPVDLDPLRLNPQKVEVVPPRAGAAKKIDFLDEAFKKFLNEQPQGTVENPVDLDPLRLNPQKVEVVPLAAEAKSAEPAKTEADLKREMDRKKNEGGKRR